MKRLLFLTAIAILISSPNLSSQYRSSVLDEIENSGSFAPLFPFQPTHNAPNNLTNVRTWPGTVDEIAGNTGFISVQGDDFVDGQGRKMRFLGTQCGMTGCFPEHEQADKLAEEFTRYGINIVRMHYVSHRTPKNGYPVKDSFIEPEQLEKFDYFISKLKQNGIYVYFQLNIARKFGRVNGLENAHLLPKYKNGVDNVNERMIELQKKFHKEILDHVNPYTGIAYKDEPCISMMEIANENSIIHSWFSKTHKFTELVEPYRSEFIQKWNAYLLNKYETTDALKAAWIQKSKTDGVELLTSPNNGDLGISWSIQKSGGADAVCQFKSAAKRDNLLNDSHLRFLIYSLSPNKADPRLYQTNLKLKESQAYCLKFKIRSDVPMDVVVRIHQDHSPYKEVGLKKVIKTDYAWKEFKFNFTASMTDNNVKLVFNNFKPGTVDLADISLSTGLDYDWPENQSLENANVEWPLVGNWYEIRQRALDYIEFLAGLEEKYFSDMYVHTKSNLNVRQPVTGTQLGYGLNKAQAGMDYCDIHAYWCHPAFPGGKWDNNNFTVRNEAIINSWSHPASAFTRVARSRILGKPYTVSEFDIPNLNFYAAEANIMMAALGAFQDWSGLIQFSWILDTDYDRQYVWPQFDMCSAPQKLVHFPACYSMFVRGDVRKGNDKVVFAEPSSIQDDINQIVKERSASAPADHESWLMNALPLAIVAGTDVKEEGNLFSEEGKTVIRTLKDVPENIKIEYQNKQIRSSTGELTWNWQEKDAGYFMVNTRHTKVFSGFVKGRSFAFSGMTLTPGKTRLDWLTLSLTLTAATTNEKPSNLLRPGVYLLAATGLVQNTNMKIVEVSKKPSTLSASLPAGGNIGTGPVLCEGINATIALAGLKDRVACYALDPDGNRICQVPVTANSSGEAVLEIDPKYMTVWYELIVE